jgi:hypothetical protein
VPCGIVGAVTLTHGRLLGPGDTAVAAEAERVADGVGVDAEVVAVGADGVLHGRAEGQDPALFGLDVSERLSGEAVGHAPPCAAGRLRLRQVQGNPSQEEGKP